MRVCLIGYGNIAKKHVDAFRALGAEIVASCNRSDSKNKLATEESGINKTYTNYLKMIEVEKPDAIINCVSFEHIYTVTKDLIPLGIPLLIEKPAGLSVIETTELIELQKQFGTKVQVALNRRHYSIIQQAISEIGGRDKIEMINLEWSENPLKTKQKKGFSDLLIAQHLYANSIHGIDMLDYFSGGISEYNSYCSSSNGYFNWHMAFSGKSKTGKLVNFTSSWGSPVPWRLVVFGNNKRLEFAPLETCKIFSDNEPNLLTLVPEKYDSELKAGFYLQTKSFIDLVTSNLINNDHSLESTLSSMAIAENLYNKLYIGK